MFPKFNDCPLDKLFQDLQNKGNTMSKPVPSKPSSSPAPSKPSVGQPPKKK